MAIAIRSGVMKESPGDPYAWPPFEAMENTVAEARCAADAARHAAERFAGDAAVQVRRHPLRAVGVAVVAGAVAGPLVGFGLGCLARTRA